MEDKLKIKENIKLLKEENMIRKSNANLRIRRSYEKYVFETQFSAQNKDKLIILSDYVTIILLRNIFFTVKLYLSESFSKKP